MSRMTHRAYRWFRYAASSLSASPFLASLFPAGLVLQAGS